MQSIQNANHIRIRCSAPTMRQLSHRSAAVPHCTKFDSCVLLQLGSLRLMNSTKGFALVEAEWWTLASYLADVTLKALEWAAAALLSVGA